MASPPSERLRRKLPQASALGMVLVGLGLSLWGIMGLLEPQANAVSISLLRFMCGFGSLLALGGVVLRFRPQMLGLNLHLLLASFCWLYLGAELICWLLVMGGGMQSHQSRDGSGWGVFSKACASFDPARGFRWENKGSRVVKVVDNEIIFDQAINPNAQGFIDEKDFTSSKTDSTKRRWIVFGDSFTGSEFLSRTWTDYAGDQLANHELYNFGVDGGGLQNWHRTFMEEVLPHYKFDGIILAVYGNDFDRDYAIFEHRDSTAWFKYFETPPENRAEFEQEYFPEMDASAEIVGEKALKARIARSKELAERSFRPEAPSLNFLMALHDLWAGFDYRRRKAEYEQKYLDGKAYKLSKYGPDAFEERYGLDKWTMLSAMLDSCRAQGKEVIFTSVPDLQGLQFNRKGDYTVIQSEIEGLGQHFGTKSYDGFASFSEIPDEELSDYFLKFDLHWSDRGAAHFGENFAKWLENQEWNSPTYIGRAEARSPK